VQRKEDSLRAAEWWARQAHRFALWALCASSAGIFPAAIAVLQG
jgi:hypothetical protein